MTEVAAPPAAAPAPEPKPNGFQRIAGVLLTPGETFESIAKRPDIVVPLLVVLLVSLSTGIIVALNVDFAAMAREVMETQVESGDVPAEAADRSVRFMASFYKVLFFASPVLGLIMLLAIAGVLHISFRLFGGEGTFKQAFSVTLYSWMPFLIKGIIATAVLASRQTVGMAELQNPVRSNLAFLVDMKTQPIPFALLSSLDLFTIWTLILFTIGFAAVSRFSRTKAAVIVVSLWLVTLLFKVGAAAMQAMRMRSS